MLLQHIEPLNGGKRFLLHFEASELRCGPQELLDFQLAPGISLDETRYEELADACELLSVKSKAASLISARALSSGELIRKLTERGASREHAEKAVLRLVELGVLNDADYACMVVRRCAAKGYGRRRAEQELYRHLLPREYWESALEGLGNVDEALDAAIDKKLRGKPLTKEMLQDLSTYLIRRGYGWEAVRAALNRRCSETETYGHL